MMPSVNISLLEIAGLLLAAPDAPSRASLAAGAIAEQLPNGACVVHRFNDEHGEMAWTVIGLAGEVSLEPSTTGSGNRLMAPLLLESPDTLIYAGDEILREDYSHLHISRSVASIAYLPLMHNANLIGAIEILTFARVLKMQDLEGVTALVHLAGTAILAAEEFEQQRQALLDSVHRMSQLYDLEKSLNSTLELEAVMAAIPEKVIAMLPCQAVHLWLFDGDDLRLMSSAGEDATVEQGMVQAAGEGYVADMAEEGEPLLIAEADDERLMLRNARLPMDEGLSPVANALLVPLMQDEAEVGVLEAVNRDERPFDDDDLFFLASMAETASSSLKNATLLHAERKLEILKALVHVSSEITSTLRLDRLLQIIVNGPQSVLPFERCAIALDHRGRLQLKAVSGMTSLPLGDAQVDRLQELMRWLSSQSDVLHLRRDEPPEEGTDTLPEPVEYYFEQTGYRALYANPLTDDQGRVGLLLYESSDPDFLDVPHIEMVKVLAGQATVAIRNALLYREVPLISLIEPLVKRKNALMNNRRSRWMTFGIALECALFLGFFPLPMRLGGNAVVAPQHLVTIAAPVDGNVTAVYAHEGQRVTSGQLLGSLDDWQWKTDLATAEAKYQSALLVMKNDLARGSAQAGADRMQVEYLRSEVDRSRARLQSAELRTPITGIVVTPNLQNEAGKHLDAGTAFAQVLDLSSVLIQVAVSEQDVALVKPGQSVVMKLDSYPRRTFRGRVFVVSPEATAGDGERHFLAEVRVPNTDASLRAGMTGHAKIWMGWKPSGYVLLRRPALWIWRTVWDWIGW